MPNLGPQSTQARSAQSLILSACRIVGVLRSGQNLSAAELSDCLQTLNDLMDAWSAKGTRVFVKPRITVDQNQNVLTLVPAQQTYTLGNVSPGGIAENFFIARPARIERVSYIYSASQQTPVERPLNMYDNVQWQGIANKNTQSLLPQVCYAEYTFPDMTLNFWPVPTQANPIVIYAWQLLTQFPDTNTPFSFPMGYSRAIRFNLAVELAAEFPCDLQKFQIASMVAKQSMVDIESLNSVPKEAYCDPALLATNYTRGNIYTGEASRTHP